MTRDEAVSHIQMQMGFRTSLSSSIILQLQLAQTTLESNPTLPWFLVSEDSYVRTEVDEDRIPLPTDFLLETDAAVLRYVPDDITATNPEVDLVKDEYDVLRKNYLDSTTGTIQVGAPQAYCILGGYFRIFPTPDDDYLLRMIYYAEDDALDTNVENQWLKYIPKLLMGVAGKQMSGGPLRDKEAWSVFDTWEREGRALLTAKLIVRELENRSLQVGGPH